MTTDALPPLEITDNELVARSLRGNRDAFGQIVGRYQALVCSLAYSATGSLSLSEDLAQETFLAAWKQLSALREPAKLRSWLCGIVRNLSYRAHRGQQREPSYLTEPMETLDEQPALEPHPLQQAISREEEGILWVQLEAIPETYREPLILFYRQHQSIEQVAFALELSADATRQRLTRGRKLLQEQVLAFVEGALERTAPGPAFTNGVLAALPLAASSAKATAAGATLATGGALAKGAATTVLGSIGGALAMLGGAVITTRALTEDAKSSRERRFVGMISAVQVLVIVLFLGTLAEWTWENGRVGSPPAPFVRDVLRSALIFSLSAIGLELAKHRYRRLARLQMEEKTFDQTEWKSPARATGAAGGNLGAGARQPEVLPLRRWLKLSALSLVFALLISVFLTPWRHHLVVALSGSVVLPLLLNFLLWRHFRSRSRHHFPSAVLQMVPVALVTLLAADVDLLKARIGADRSQAASLTAIISLNLAIILAYAILGRIIVLRRRGWMRWKSSL
jgi:RNA polymerase sigma factor (sigma-70 family)